MLTKDHIQFADEAELFANTNMENFHEGGNRGQHNMDIIPSQLCLPLLRESHDDVMILETGEDGGRMVTQHSNNQSIASHTKSPGNITSHARPVTPCKIGQGKIAVGHLPGTVGHLPGSVGHLPGQLGHIPGQVGHLPGQVIDGQVPHISGQVGHIPVAPVATGPGRGASVRLLSVGGQDTSPDSDQGLEGVCQDIADQYFGSDSEVESEPAPPGSSVQPQPSTGLATPGLSWQREELLAGSRPQAPLTRPESVPRQGPVELRKEVGHAVQCP